MTDPSHPDPHPLVAEPRLSGTVRELGRFAGRPNLGAGLRAAVATVVPMLAAAALDLPGATWLGLAGFSVAIADKGGAYATRARTMGALTLAIALAGVLGAVASGKPQLSIPLIFAWALVGAFIRAFGAAAVSVGVSSTITFVISLAAPAHGFGDAMQRGELLLVGGALALALSLFLWPIRAYRPARQALAACYRSLAAYADAIATGHPRDFGPFRASLEASRATLAATRRGRPGETGRGERLLMLTEAADRTFAATAALAGVVDGGGSADSPAEERARVAAAAVAGLARELADAVERERTPAPPPPFPTGGENAPELADRLAAAVRREALRAWEAAAGVESGRPVRLPESPPAQDPPIREVLRENLTLDSVTLRHALRVAVTAAAATGLAHFIGVQRGYWVTLTALIVLQPSAGATWVKGLQRIGGTMMGGVAAAAIGALVHDPRALLAIIFVLAAGTASMLQVNYAVYSALLTPTFVLLAETSVPDRHLPWVRVANTLLGGVLALAAARLLWPAPERLALRGRLAEALRACATYLRVAARRHAGTATRAEADEARRGTGLAVLNAEESLQVVLWEGGAGHAPEAGMAALAFLRRLGEAVNALAYAPGGGPAAAEVTAFGEAAASALESLAAAMTSPSPAGAFPELHPPHTPDAAVNARLAVISDVIAALERVLARGLVEASAT